MPAQMEPEQRWLITGATGFVGSVVSKEAAARGFRVIGVSRRAHGAAVETIDWTQGADAVARIMERHQPHFVFHAAGSSSVGSSMEDPGADFQASVGTWAALLEGVRRSGIRPVVPDVVWNRIATSGGAAGSVPNGGWSACDCIHSSRVM